MNHSTTHSRSARKGVVAARVAVVLGLAAAGMAAKPSSARIASAGWAFGPLTAL
jgi:hypothetical protein